MLSLTPALAREIERGRGVIEGDEILAPIPKDPASLGWSPIFLLEIALKEHPIETICAEYHISEQRWEELRNDPLFIRELRAVVAALKDDGLAFQVRAKVQAGELLKDSWDLIHNAAVPPSVRADLIKFTIRAAGYDASQDSKNAGGGNSQHFSITLNLA